MSRDARSRPPGPRLSWLWWMPWGLCVLLALLCCRCEQAVTPANTRESLACSPWLKSSSTGVWNNLGGGLPEGVQGCLLIARGEAMSRATAMLRRSGALWGWDGKAFSAEAPLRLAPPGGDGSSYQFWFYVPSDLKLSHAQLEQACQGYVPTSYRKCLASGERSCLFALAFRPSIEGVASQQIELIESAKDITIDKAPNCRLLYPFVDTSSISFATRTPQSCRCLDPSSFQPAAALKLDADAQAVAVSDDGLALAAVAGKTLHLYLRTDASSDFGDAAHTFSLPANGWQLQFDGNKRFLAIVMDTRIEVWSFERLQAGESQVVFSKDAGSGQLAAAAAFRPGVSATIAMAFYEKSENGVVAMWSFAGSAGAKPKLRASVSVFGPQALAFDRNGNYLVVGFGIPPGRSGAGARFQVIPIEGADDNVTFGTPRSFFTQQTRSAVTTLAVSPTNEYLVIGTGPELPALRSLIASPPEGQHGRIELRRTNPLTEDSGVLALPNEVFAHSGYTQRIVFGAGGELLAALGQVGTDGSHEIHLWKPQAKFPYFQYVTSLTPPQGTRDIAFGPGCGTLFAAAKQSPSLPVWKGCL